LGYGGMGGVSMRKPENAEQVGPQSRIPLELVRLESQKREFWTLIIFADVVLLLGALSFFFPHRFWHGGSLQISLSPQVLFVIMVGTVLASLYCVRRDIELRTLRLASIQQHLNSREEQAKSMLDSVTQVFTRPTLQSLLTNEISRAERAHRPLALMMCDLNNFKLVNDRHGHLIGDYVLAQVATILKISVRGSDYVVRYGGDEFIVLMPETDQEGGEIVLQRVRRKVADWDRSNRVCDLPISVSLGLHLHVAGHTAEMDVAEADSRMYADKQATKHGAIARTLPLPR
jgi:diguanylate cyclase (GGDEF)-like protein